MKGIFSISTRLPLGGALGRISSAGVSLMAALISVLTSRPVPRDMAMTGEITLRGQIMPIGGLKEKSLAALRAGLKKIIIPRQNLKDLEDIPPLIRGRLEFIDVENMDQFLKAVFGSTKPQARRKARRPRNRPAVVRGRHRPPLGRSGQER